MPTSNSLIKQEKKMLRDHGDVYYKYKFQIVDTDVVIYKALNRVNLSFVNLDVIKEMLQPDKVDLCPKTSTSFRGIPSLLGEGLVFSEGDTWRTHRKIVSKLFSFNMILSNIGLMKQTCVKVLDEVE